MPKCRLHAVALLEAVHASARIDELLLAGVERMALRADIDAQLLLHGTRFKRLAANAANDRLAVVRMDLFLHGIHLTLTGLSPLRRRRHPINHTLIIIARKTGRRNSVGIILHWRRENESRDSAFFV